jgi:hypothetical protein
MIRLKKQRILNEHGRTQSFLINKNEFKKIEDYIEDLEDSLELAEAIQNASGFRLWEEFVEEYMKKN